MTQRFTIPARLPGLNEYTAAQRSNAQKGARMKREQQGTVSLFIRTAHLQPVSAPVRLRYHFYEPNKRRDLDNISGFAHKVIQDALVKCGVLTGDGWANITGYTDTFSVDKLHPRIEVEIEEDEDNG